jgi:hypothetical protein
MNAEVAMLEAGVEAAKTEAVEMEVAGRISSVKRGRIVRAEGNR